FFFNAPATPEIYTLSLHDALPISLSPFRRPTIESMPVDAKAGCLYPNNGRALFEAGKRGFDNCLLCDMLGNVAELATANVFFARSEEHTSELQSLAYLVCRLLLEK